MQIEKLKREVKENMTTGSELDQSESTNRMRNTFRGETMRDKILKNTRNRGVMTSLRLPVRIVEISYSSTRSPLTVGRILNQKFRQRPKTEFRL